MMKNFAVNNMSNFEKGIYHQNGTVTATEIHPSQQEMDNLKLLVESGSSDEALKQARELSERYAGSFLIWDTLGVYLSNNGDIDPALDAFQKSISLEPGYHDAYDHLAVTLNRKAEKFLKRNMFAKAKQFYERSLKIKIENPLALNNIGVISEKLGNNEQAIDYYAKAVVVQPDYLDALFNLSVILQKCDRVSEAYNFYNRILALEPNFPEVHNNIGNIYRAKKNYAEAISSYKRALTIEPNYEDAKINLSIAYLESNNIDRSIVILQDLISESPDNEKAYLNLAICFNEMNRDDDAKKVLEKALSINPNMHEAYNNYGMIFYDEGLYNEAFAKFDKAISLKFDYADAHLNLGNCFKQMDSFDQAMACYQRAISLKPELVEALLNIGNLLKLQGEVIEKSSHKIEESIIFFKNAIKLKTDYAEAHNNMGTSLASLGKLTEAIRAYEQAITIRPMYKEAHLNLGNALKELGRLSQAEVTYRKAIEIDHDYAEAYSNMLFCMSYNPENKIDQIVSEHLRYGAHFEKKQLLSTKFFENDMDENKVLRIGFVSGDFRDHPVADYFAPILSELKKKDDCQLFGYYNFWRTDDRTVQLKNNFHNWQSIWGKKDISTFNIIRSDQVDVLIDLSGHTAYNRLPVFAKKPAPIQVSMFGSPFTTGLKSIDYYIGDKNGLKAEDFSHQFSEKIVGLPSTPPYILKTKRPVISQPPILDNGYITFGSFFNTAKINMAVLKVWSHILRETPNSRLLIGSIIGFETVNRFKTVFESQNIDLNRINFVKKLEYENFLSLHNKVDLCLAPFPNTGGTTVFASLWMGVPTLILEGNSYFTRGSASIMKSAGCSEFVVNTEDAYLQKACDMAKNKELLSKIKKEIPETLKQSSLCNPSIYANSLSQAIRQMWTSWCRNQTPKSFEL